MISLVQTLALDADGNLVTTNLVRDEKGNEAGSSTQVPARVAR
jgi:hypothetical protein